ncbi:MULTISPECIES: hypothetical protein [unclassified Streptomyces]|uniref:hypothetical protein n=1 Tax=unclassified Streptomyces TaxID=2593676 RepID=UPI0036F7F4AF
MTDDRWERSTTMDPLLACVGSVVRAVRSLARNLLLLFGRPVGTKKADERDGTKAGS